MLGHRRLATNASAVLAGRAAAVALGVLLSTVLFRTLGGERYGAWSLLTVVAGYSTLVDFGLSTAVARRVAHLWVAGERAAVVRTLNSTLVMLVGSFGVIQAGVVVVWAALPSGFAVPGGLGAGLLILPACAGVTLAGLATGAVLSGQERWRVLQLCRTAGLAAGSGLTMALAWGGVRRLDLLLAAFTSGSVLALWASWRAIRHSVRELRPRLEWDRDAIRELVQFGGVMQVATIVPPLGEYAFRIIVGARFGLEYAGVYDLASRAAFVLRSLAGALFTAMVPFAVRVKAADGVAGLARLARVTTRYTASFMWPASAVLLACAGPLIRTWLGPTPLVDPVRLAFIVLLVAHAVGSLGAPVAMIARAIAKPAPEAIATSLAFGFALLAIQPVSSFVVATGILWGLPALAALLLRSWLARALGLGASHPRDLAAASVVAVAAFAVARVALRFEGTASWSLAVALLAGMLVTALGLAAFELGLHPDGAAVPALRRWLTGGREDG